MNDAKYSVHDSHEGTRITPGGRAGTCEGENLLFYVHLSLQVADAQRTSFMLPVSWTKRGLRGCSAGAFPAGSSSDSPMEMPVC